MKDKAKIWDRLSRLYDKIIKKDKLAYEQIIKMIKQSSRKEDKILEIGTATGVVAFGLANHFKTLQATDFSHKMIQIAKDKSEKIDINNIIFSVEDACNLSYCNDEFDVVIAANILHIMPEPKKALAEVKRVLVDGGILYAPTFVYNKGLKIKFFSKFGSIIGFKIHNKWTQENFKNFLADQGFTIIDSKVLKSSISINYVMCKVSK